MRMSCNGCRVLRKGCSEDCTIRPCLQWIKSPEEQGNATLFLAKFYGRAGLLNLIGAGPDHLRPAIFRSLLYEACGRIVNPIFGSVGLLWSNNWPLCQAAVEAVLKGKPITQIPSEKATGIPMPPPKAFDIRHVPKKGEAVGTISAHVHKVARTGRTAFKREGSSISSNDTKNGGRSKVVRQQESSHSDEYHRPTSSGSGSMVSEETLEVEASTPEQRSNEIHLDLTLRLGSYAKATSQPTSFCIDDPIGGGRYDRSSA